MNALQNAVTAGGTLPALPLPSFGLGSQEKRLPPPPPKPPTHLESVVKHVKARPVTYSLLGGVSLTMLGTAIAVHVSPAFRARLFSTFPLLKPIYLNQRRALPSTPRPRVSLDGKHRLEAVLVLGCEPGSYGREVAKAFERQGFIVIASVSSSSEVDELEFSGNGYIKAIVLDSASVSPLHRQISAISQVHTEAKCFSNSLPYHRSRNLLDLSTPLFHCATRFDQLETHSTIFQAALRAFSSQALSTASH